MECQQCQQQLSSRSVDVVSRPSVVITFSQRQLLYLQCESEIPPCGLRFSNSFSQTLENFKSIFTHLLYVPIYARLQIFIQLSQTLTKLFHIKRDYLVRVLCSKCPPSAETHAFRRLRKSLIALLIVVCGKSSQIYCFYSQQV